MEKDIRVKMNEKILNVILAVLAYKKYVYRHNCIVPESGFDWYKKTQEYYNSLPLPDGMNKNISDFEKILSYERNKYTLEILCKTEYADLHNYSWKF